MKIYVWIAITLLSGCVSVPPHDVNNICSIFKQYPRWYDDAKDVEKRWRVPLEVQMAIIHQESKFNARAQPGRKKLLSMIPWTRPSTAYGYAQALRGTWALYKKNNGSLFSARDDFADGVDFIGWYANMAYRQAGIPRNDAYRLYLAYHEGIGGFRRKTYLRKSWLPPVARKVQARAAIYRAQLVRCHQSLPNQSGHKFW
ncbi:MAG: transglycosylase SLT domain-containing protein [Legionella sp.]